MTSGPDSSPTDGPDAATEEISSDTELSASTGAEDSEGDLDDSTSGGIAATAELRVIHAVSDAGAVDVYLAGDPEPLLAGLDYSDASPWLTIEAGTYAIELRAAGSEPEAEPVYVSDELALADGERMSAVAAGLMDAPPDASLRILPVREDWGTDLADRARVRIVHAGADAPALLVDGLAGNPFELDRFANSRAEGVAIDVDGGERIELLDGETPVTSFTTPPLAEGDQVIIVATGVLDSLAKEDDGFSLLAIGPRGSLGRILQDPQLFTLHGARDAGNLENCSDGFELAANFTYGEIQSTRVSPGEYSFKLYDYPSGCTGTALNLSGNASGPLEPGERYLLLLTGERDPDGSDPSLQVATFRDRFSLDDVSGSSIRFVHGASAEQIYVGGVASGEIPADNVYTDPVVWRSESVERALDPGPYLLGVADAVGEPAPPLQPLVTFNYTATPAARQWGIISGDPSPETGDGFLQLMLVDTATPGWSVQLVDVNTSVFTPAR